MRRLVLLLLLVPALAFAAPDRAGLIKAWEAAMNRDGSLTAQPDGSYRYRNEAIGYDGAVNIVSAIVRSDAHGTRIAAGTAVWLIATRAQAVSSRLTALSGSCRAGM